MSAEPYGVEAGAHLDGRLANEDHAARALAFALDRIEELINAEHRQAIVAAVQGDEDVLLGRLFDLQPRTKRIDIKNERRDRRVDAGDVPFGSLIVLGNVDGVVGRVAGNEEISLRCIRDVDCEKAAVFQCLEGASAVLSASHRVFQYSSWTAGNSAMG